MYTEIATLSALFMVKRWRISFLLPMLWTFFGNLIQWPTPEQWINMTNNWQHFPREVARVAAIEETSPFVY